MGSKYIPKPNNALRDRLAAKAAAKTPTVAPPTIPVGVLNPTTIDRPAHTPEQMNAAMIAAAHIDNTENMPDSIPDPAKVSTTASLPMTNLQARLAEIRKHKDTTVDIVELRKEHKEKELSLRDRLAQLAANKEDTTEVVFDLPINVTPSDLVMRGKDQITYEDLNPEQQRAIALAEQGVDFNLIGPAGSGKTTTTKMVAETLEASGLITELGESTKWLKADAPSIVFVSFTNQAVTNIRQAVPDSFKANCLTIHKLLEYAPVFYDYTDPSTGEDKTTMRYEPQRGAFNKLTGITHVVVEEAGSVGAEELFNNLRAALPDNVVWIFLGDLNQLPPVFDDAILGFKLLELPIVELTKSYRTDSTSPIRLLAYKVLEGKPLADEEVDKLHVAGELELVRFKDRVNDEHAIQQVGEHFQQLVQMEYDNAGTGFNPEEDVVLIPFNKKFGSIELNNYIAQKITEINQVPTYEIMVGFIKKYFAVGDIVYQAKNKWRIVEIKENTMYGGKKPNPPSTKINRWGTSDDPHEAAMIKQAEEGEIDIEELFNTMAAEDMKTTNEVSFHQASHIIVLEDVNEELNPKEIRTCADVNEMYLAYALTVHKSQGSEWKKVFCVFHHSHGVMLKREILYTAITRAREFCRIYYSGEDRRTKAQLKNTDGTYQTRKVLDSVFQKGITKQYIKGDTISDKLDFFRNKLRSMAMADELERVKNNEGAVYNPSNVDLDSDATLAKKLLYKMTHATQIETTGSGAQILLTETEAE